MRGSLSTGRIGHAYIFHGPGGVGKKLTALNFAKAANCLAEEAARPCEACASCKKIASFNHPDLSILMPEKEGASIKIEAIRGLIKDIGLKPYEGRKKFYIIDGAQFMTEEAANALLKTLEEPPSDSVLILITENLGSLLSTIVSRSQVVKFFPLRVDEVRDILVKAYAVDPARSHVLSHLSSGRLGEALKYNDKDFFARRERIISALSSGKFFESDFDKLTKAELKMYLNIMLTWYRDILVTKASGGDGSGVVNADKLEAISREAASTGFEHLEKVIRQIISTAFYVDQNVNPKLAMAALGVSVA